MRFLLLLTSSLFILTSYAQKVVVVDSESKIPLQFVSVVAYPSQQSITTNAKGVADIKVLSGNDYLLFQMMGYQRSKVKLTSLNSSVNCVFLQKSYFDVGEVVISATRWKQQRRDVSQKISTISPEDFRLLNPQTSADLLTPSGDVYIQKSQQGGGSPMIRGFSTNRLLYAVDGIRMNNAIFRSGNLQNVISLDAFAMENVEVLFGPGAIIYG